MYGFSELGIHALRDPPGPQPVQSAPTDDPGDATCLVDLRILATSDLHAHLTACDYLSGRRRNDIGLTRVASLVRAARAEAANTLLFDNGDAIEGSVLADHAFATGRGDSHPVIAAMNAMGYDAAALGNHEFSHGLPFLHAAMSAMKFPAVSANISWADGRGPVARPHVMLDRQVTDRGGRKRGLRIGVFGVTPPQVLVWDRRQIGGQLAATGMVEAATRAAAALRAEGADIVVGLCHAGLSALSEDAENPGLALVTKAGADAVVLGHAHQVFPGAAFADLPGVDLSRGLLAGRPVVMPGSHGSHLGLMDLTLRYRDGAWTVTGARAEVAAVGGNGSRAVPEDRGLRAVVMPAERRARRWLSARVGWTAQPLDSYFAVAAPSPLMRVSAEAKAAYLARHLQGTPHEGLPVLAAVSPFRAGGRGGPLNYVDVPAGPLTRRHLADIYVHPNAFAAVVVTGRTLADWLERGVSGYHRQIAGAPLPLADPAFPAFAFEAIHGLSYRIDLAAPARHDARGGLADPVARRIRDLTWQGRPLDPAARFAVATNSYRASLLIQQMGSAVLTTIESGTPSRQVVSDWLAGPGTPRTDHGLAPGTWSFLPLGRRVPFETGPGALRHLARIAPLQPEVVEIVPGGFVQLSLQL